MTIKDLIAQSEVRWSQVKGTPESALLRLAILRDLMRGIHAEKSRVLAKASDAAGDRNVILPLKRPLKQIETRVHELRSHPSLDGDLTELLHNDNRDDSTSQTPARKLPKEIFARIPRNSLERYDRPWEAAIAAEACKVGWEFWALDAQIEITRAEERDRALNLYLWPNGVSLFVENNGESGESEGLWHGRWTVVLRPGFRRPESWPETQTSVIPVKWQLLFSPSL